MSDKKPLVVVTRRLPDVVETRMRELFDAQLNIDDHPMSRDELITAVGKAEVLVPTVTDRIDSAVLSQAGDQLKLIANFGTGVDNVDLETARNRGIIVTNTEPLPAEYRIEYTLRTVDFGGKRDGSFDYDGKTNGYENEGCKSNYPWIRSGDYSGDTEPCSDAFGDVRAENGFYLLSIMDYDNPAPHNNVFIHNHRKVGMDTYSVNAPWSSGYKVCNPETGELIGYDEGNANGINQIFFDGTRFRDASIGYNQFIMPTECGLRDGATSGESIVATAELQPELMPDETYNFAIERSSTGYVTEMTGNFRHVGETTLRYERDFVEDGTPIWHFNQTADEYDGEFDQTLTFEGPFGSYDVEQWPADSEYPDHFIIGDPHLNYYEGSASFTNIRLFVPDDGE